MTEEQLQAKAWSILVWMKLNNDLMDIANYLSRIGIPVFIRPHPSLSKSRIQNNI